MSRPARNSNQVPVGRSDVSDDSCPALEGRTVESDHTRPGGINDVGISGSDAGILNFHSRLVEKYPEEFDHAAAWILKVSKAANIKRENMVRQQSLTARNVSTVMLSSPDDAGVDEHDPSLSPPKTSEPLNASTPTFEELIPLDPMPTIRDRPRTITGGYSSKPGLSHAYNVHITPSQNHDTKSSRNCPFCGTGLGAFQGPMRHLVSHIKMWHCCQPDCEYGNLLFDSQEAWMEHTIHSHGNRYQWICAGCKTCFDQRELLRSHLIRVHNVECNGDSLQQRIEDSREALPHKQCHFCRGRPTFDTWADYSSHVCKHLEHISSIVVSPLAPVSKSQKYTNPVTGLLRRCLGLMNCLASGMNEKSHKQRVMIWDDLERRQYSHWILRDTGAEKVNVILRSVVDKRGLQTFTVEPDPTSIEFLNHLCVDASEYVMPEWHYWIEGQHRIRRDIKFLVVESIPSDVDMVLANDSPPRGRLSSLVMKLDTQPKERVIDQHQTSVSQIQDGVRRKASREAKLKAARYPEPGAKPLSDQPESPASSRREERRGDATRQLR